MALETERSQAEGVGLDAVPTAVSRWLGALSGGFRGLGRGLTKISAGAGRWWRAFPLVRFVSGSLWRRILIASLAGLVVMFGGILYFSENNAWLIDAKRESLLVQGEIIAAAIASDTRAEGGRLIIHTDSLPSVDKAEQPDDSAFTAHELSIRPERVAPILRRLVQPTTRRARVYSRDGTLVMDSAILMKRGQLSRHEPKVNNTGSRMGTKNFWTRLKSWMIGEELPVYKEIGNANGTSYPEVRQALQGTPTAMLLLNDKGQQIVSTAVPIQRASVVQGVLLMSTRPGEIDQIVADQQSQIWILAVFAGLATLLSALLLARTVAGPIRRLSESAKLVSRNISARHELPDFAHRTDEVGQMASAFAAMTAGLYRRIEASESFAADVAHELKNPLAAARSMAESLSYAKTDEQRKEVVSQIQNELKRLNRLITDVSNASRLDAELARQQMGPVDVTNVVASVTQIFRDILSGDTRRVETNIAVAPFEGAFLISGHAGRLSQVLTNLVDNAISFSPEERAVVVRVRRVEGFVEVAVEDEGPGIPEDRLTIIFDRFYTDRPDTEAVRGKNSGLGLSISREIIRAHGGEISAENRWPAGARSDDKPLGARFVVRLPGLLASARSAMTSGRRPVSERFNEPVHERT
ncbi:stimulus-sensing domain-containing protein [Hyphomicrobium sp.]|uniref:stimulus-sensing domain-containing protein n=1 Tax=Hyphomicrobium sp. TaxID=82 RepID=UPI002E33B402|nr:stimulus-sensing domain-containing protein [Hyphomicrobium sp.]HEX2843422.1 stimulus-sensing domain-containing protein [Hyphomicrobium sp.]